MKLNKLHLQESDSQGLDLIDDTGDVWEPEAVCCCCAEPLGGEDYPQTCADCSGICHEGCTTMATTYPSRTVPTLIICLDCYRERELAASDYGSRE